MVRRIIGVAGAVAGILASAAVARADPAFALYFSASGPDAVLKFDAAGNQTTFATAGLSSPTGLAFDAAGDLFVANAGNGTIREFSPTGGDLGVFASGLSSPQGLAFDAAGNLFVANSQADDILVYTPSRQLARTITIPGLFGPQGLVFNAAGDLFIANPGQSDIIELDSSGVPRVFARTFIGAPFELTLDNSGRLVAALGRSFGEVDVFNADGSVRDRYSQNTTIGFGFTGPGVAIDPLTGNIYSGNAGSFGLAAITEINPNNRNANLFVGGLNSDSAYLAFRPQSVPEPTSLASIAAGGLVLAAARSRRGGNGVRNR